MPGEQTGATINRWYFLIGLLPALVFLVNLWVLTNYALPFDIRPDRLAEFDLTKEGAARIGAAAAFLLVAGAAGAILLCCSYRVLKLGGPGRLAAAITYVALSAAALGTTGVAAPGAEEYPGRTLFCLAAAYNHADSLAAREAERADIERAATPASPATAGQAKAAGALQKPGVAVDRLPYWKDHDKKNCAHPRFDKARSLAALQFLLVVLAFSALVVGAISCLAEPEPNPSDPAGDADPKPDRLPAGKPGSEAGASELQAHWESQAKWLNICLYLGALLLGAALVFIGAFLRWPLYALPSAEGYENYTSAMLAYYGCTFSLMLTSFYVPVAARLAAKVKSGAAAAAETSKLPEAFRGPLQLLKIVLGLASTALAGALPGIIDMIA
ncbi:MAG TPA: hypothetical protein VF782_11145 [Allosphingosinicella sp.]